MTATPPTVQTEAGVDPVRNEPRVYIRVNGLDLLYVQCPMLFIAQSVVDQLVRETSSAMEVA